MDGSKRSSRLTSVGGLQANGSASVSDDCNRRKRYASACLPVRRILTGFIEPDTHGEDEQIGYVPGEIIVGLGGEAEERLRQLVKSWNGAIVEELPGIHAFQVRVDERSVSATVYRAEGCAFDYIERNYYVHSAFRPSDPLWAFQWGLQKARANLAWDMELGKRSVVVAVIDTGIDYNHGDWELPFRRVRLGEP